MIREMRIMRLKDIADEAGVSVSTVSRVLSGKNIHDASPELRDRILDIAHREKFTQNAAAQSLRHGTVYHSPEPRVVACIFARTPSKDPFFMQLSRSATDYFIQQSCIVKYTLSLQEVSSEMILDIFSENRLDGVVILGRCESDFMVKVHSLIKNLIYVSLNKRDIQYDQVLCDGFKAGEAAVDQLYALGHRKIGYIGELNDEIRYKAYEHYMSTSQGLVLEPQRIVDVILSAEGGYSGMMQLMERSPDTTGVFCANDTTAMGALRACRELGLNVPKDISIIGMDDLDTSQYLSPLLSTVHIPISEMGCMAAKILLSRIDHEHNTPIIVSFPSHPILRESCAKPRITLPC